MDNIPKVTIALESETTSISNRLPENATSKIMGDYTPDQINAILCHLSLLIQNSTSTEIGYNHDAAVLIDLICSNELYETLLKHAIL